MTTNVQTLNTDTQQTLHVFWIPAFAGMTIEVSFEPMLVIKRPVIPAKATAMDGGSAYRLQEQPLPGIHAAKNDDS